MGAVWRADPPRIRRAGLLQGLLQGLKVHVRTTQTRRRSREPMVPRRALVSGPITTFAAASPQRKYRGLDSPPVEEVLF